jgi:hypothetical protein
MKVLVAPLLMPGMLMKAQWALLEIVQQRWPLVKTDCQRTEMRRSQIAEHLMEDKEADAVVMLDGDHKHPADIVYRLRHDAEQLPQADVIGALCFRRSEPYDPCFWQLNAEGKYCCIVPWQEGLLEVDAVGFGAVLFRRRCFEVLPKPHFTYDYVEAAEGFWPTEDIGFSMRARAVGLRLFVDTTLVSPHLFEGEVDDKTCRSYIAAHPKEAVEQQEV